MKKIIVFILAGITAVSFAGCGISDSGSGGGNGSSSVQETESIKDPVELLSSVWSSFDEESRFPVAGGDFSEENMNPEGAGRYSISDPEALDNALGFPAALSDKLEDAASLVHMMNSNTFTAAAYQLKDEKDAESTAAELKQNILSRQWMCGMPDKLVVLTSGKYVVACFGENELADTFRDNLMKTYSSFKVVSEDAVTA